MKNILKKIFTFEVPTENNKFIIKNESDSVLYDVRKEEQDKKEEVLSKNYDLNLEYIKYRFSYPENNDVVIRNIKLK